MKVELSKYSVNDGWQPALQPQLDSAQTLVLAFGSAAFDEHTQAFSDLKNAFPTAHILGCSTAGEIFDDEIFDDTLSVAVARFDHTRLASGSVQVQSAGDSFQSGRDIATTLQQPDLKGLLVLSDGLSVNGSELVRGINTVLDDNIVVTGGLAGDGDRFQQTWVIREGKPVSGYITAVAYYGDKVRISHGSKGGWDSFGPRRKVTRAESNVLYELDGKPALALYKEYLGHRADGLPATALLFPLALHADDGSEDYTVRTVLAVDEEEQSMTFAGDIPEGYQVQLMQADFERLIDGAYDAASMAGQDTDSNGDHLNIAISCVGRRLVLGERSEDEIEATLEVLPAGTRQVGFYSYGEISPYVNGQNCQLHNQTMTLTTLSESP